MDTLVAKMLESGGFEAFLWLLTNLVVVYSMIVIIEQETYSLAK
jgi:hypothetical protein